MCPSQSEEPIVCAIPGCILEIISGRFAPLAVDLSNGAPGATAITASIKMIMPEGLLMQASESHLKVK
jgi:hypothetical protein